jgi:hypothetical protein
MLTRRIVKYLVVTSLLLRGGTGVAQSQADAAEELFSNVQTFAFGGVGYAGQTSAGEIDFRAVLVLPKPDALAAFERLYATGSPEAKAYALSGIRKLNPQRFQDLLAVARESKDRVAVMRGCIMTEESLRVVAKKIDRGDWDYEIDHHH